MAAPKESRASWIVWATIGIMCGGLILLFGLDLHNKYKFGDSYNNALHIHPAAGLFIIVGGVVTLLGLVSLIGAIFAGRD